MRCAIVLLVIEMMSAAAAGQTTRPVGEVPPVDLLRNLSGVPARWRLPQEIEVLERPVLMAPVGMRNLALRRPVKSSDKDPTWGDLKMITDGEKDFGEGYDVELAPGPQWVQIDLGKNCEIWGVAVWHLLRAEHAPRVYRAVIVQVSDDATFATDVKTIFNNDTDGSSRMGAGKDNEYVETRFGKLVLANRVKARYVRSWSNGNTHDDGNHYCEIEVYGVDAREATTRPAGEPKFPVEIRVPKPVLTFLNPPRDAPAGGFD